MSRTVTGAGLSERLLLIAAALVLSVLAGAFVAKVEFIWVLAILGVLAAAALVASREATLWFILVFGLVITGLSQLYLAEAKYIKYLAPLAAGGLLMHVVSEWLASPRRSVPRTVPLFLVFLGLSLLSLAVNFSSFGMLVVGLKSYYPMWALFLGLALIRWQRHTIDSLPKAALVLAVLQLPFVVHQALFLVPMRQGIPGVVPVDIIAGTFGGDMWGGGANAVLSLLLITVMAALLGLWLHGAVSGLTALLGSLALLAPVVLNSSRVALLYVPLVFIIVFHADVLRHPLRALAGVLLAGVLAVGILLAFTSASREADTWQEYLRTVYAGQVASERERADLYSGFSRLTVLTFWFDQAGRMNPLEVLLGHGPGATRVQPDGLDLAETLAERRYGGRQIGYTSVAALLWEVGVLGLLSVLAIFWAAFRQAGEIARRYHPGDPVRAGIAQGLQAAVAVLAISLAHKDFLAFHIPYQTLVVCVLGYLAAQINFLNAAEARSGGWRG